MKCRLAAEVEMARGTWTVVVMSFIGLVLGLVFDRLVGLLGINLGKLDHHE